MMLIESVAAKPDRAGRYLVRLADGTTMRLYRQTVEDYALYPGLELTREQLTALKKDAGQMSAKMRAVRIVAAASVSRGDLCHRLIQKGEDPYQAEEAVTWMEEMRLVDDRETAAQIVSRCVAKGYGLARARQALYEKRIPKEYWQEALENYPDQTEKIVEYLRSHLQSDSDERQRRRVTDALIRRGHSFSQIRHAMEQLNFEELPEEYNG